LAVVASTAPLPIADSEQSISEHLKRCRRLGIKCASLIGVKDPEAVFLEAYWSILKDPHSGAKEWGYLPHRIKSRACSAYRSERRRAQQLPTVPLMEDHLMAAPASEQCQELPWLAEAWRNRLQGLSHADFVLVVLHYFLELSFTQIASMPYLGLTSSALKTRLFRIRAELRIHQDPTQPALL